MRNLKNIQLLLLIQCVIVACSNKNELNDYYIFSDTNHVEARIDYEMFEELDTLFKLKINTPEWLIMYNNLDTAAIKIKKGDTTILINFWRGRRLKLLEKYFRNGSVEKAFCKNGTLLKNSSNRQFSNEYYCSGKAKCMLLNSKNIIWFREDGSVLQKGKLNNNMKLHDTLWLYDDSSNVISFQIYENGISKRE